jgi:hypothetical protein
MGSRESAAASAQGAWPFVCSAGADQKESNDGRSHQACQN